MNYSTFLLIPIKKKLELLDYHLVG